MYIFTYVLIYIWVYYRYTYIYEAYTHFHLHIYVKQNKLWMCYISLNLGSCDSPVTEEICLQFYTWKYFLGSAAYI